MFKRFGGFGIYTNVNRILTCGVTLLIAVFALGAEAATTRATLLLSASAAKPGTTITAAVRLEMAPGWHTYWKNSGASGIATAIKWELPPGLTAGEISWPVPDKYITEKVDDDGKAIPGALDFEQTTYVLHEEAVLLVPLTVAPDVAVGQMEIKAQVSWLECQVNCVPGNQEVTASLEIASATTPSRAAGSFQNWNERLPKDGGALAPKASWAGGITNKMRALLLEWRLSDKSSGWDFFPDQSDDFDLQHQTELVSTNNGVVQVRKLVTSSSDAWPKEISGVLVQKRAGQTEGYFARLAISGETAADVGAMASGAPTRESKPRGGRDPLSP